MAFATAATWPLQRKITGNERSFVIRMQAVTAVIGPLSVRRVVKRMQSFSRSSKTLGAQLSGKHVRRYPV
jgi:hypothetical protein